MKRKFRGKSGSYGSRKRRRFARKYSKRAFKSSILRTLLSVQETKRLRFNVANFGWSNGGISTWNIMAQSAAQGTTEKTFIGNKLFIKGIKLKLEAYNG